MSEHEYRQYLLSEKWQLRRKIALRRADNRCEKCESNRELHVHHVTYTNVGNEPLKDLAVLCADCHQAEHPHRELVMRMA